MDKPLIQKIKQMVKMDQSVRLLVSNKSISEKIIRPLVYLTDIAHNTIIHNLIIQYGYPNQKLLGKVGLRNFWLLVQHQDLDRKLQKDCLKNCDFAPKEKAFLTDRLLAAEEGRQLYGTQFRLVNGQPKIIPIKDIKNLYKRRKNVGLEPFSVYKAKHLARLRKLSIFKINKVT